MNTLDSTQGHTTNGINVDTIKRRTARTARSDFAVGIMLLLVVVLLWTGSNFLTQNIFVGGYEKPFLITYMNTSAFTLYLVPVALRSQHNWRLGVGSGQVREVTDFGYRQLPNTPDEVPNDIAPISSGTTSFPEPLTTKETAKLALLFCVLWFIANWSQNASLDYTSVASATILASLSGIFTFGMGKLFGVEEMSWVKTGAVLTSLGGVVLVSVSDSEKLPSLSSFRRPKADMQRALIGDVLALLSAVFYAFYVILLKVRIRTESRIDMKLFFGYVGLFNALVLWPIGALLHILGVERLEWPRRSNDIGALLTNMAITLSSDYIYVLAMLKTTPLVATIGLSLTIPFAVVGDFLLLHRPARGGVLVGAALVLFSFAAVGAENSRRAVAEAIDDQTDEGGMVED